MAGTVTRIQRFTFGDTTLAGMYTFAYLRGVEAWRVDV